MSIAEKLKTLRRTTGKTQSQLAKYLGMGQSTISQWETGESKPNCDAIKKLCDYYEVSADYLYGLVDENGEYSGIKELNAQQKSLVDRFEKISPSQKMLMLEIIAEFS